MTITATEFKSHLGKYLALAQEEDIYITKNNRRIAKLTKPSAPHRDVLDKIAGIAADYSALSLDDFKDDRLHRQ